MPRMMGLPPKVAGSAVMRCNRLSSTISASWLILPLPLRPPYPVLVPHDMRQGAPVADLDLPVLLRDLRLDHGPVVVHGHPAGPSPGGVAAAPPSVLGHREPEVQGLRVVRSPGVQMRRA